MIEHSVRDKVIHKLFDPNLPNSPALWAVLKGNHPGKVVVDKGQNPASCVLRTGAALTYFSRKTSQSFLDQTIGYFRESGNVWLVWPQQTALRPPQCEEAVVIHRLEFFDCDPSAKILDKLRQQLPSDFCIQPIDAKLFKRCAWREEMEYYSGSFDNFLEHGIGICLLKGEEIIVEAYASSLGKTRAELGAITREGYRGKGYAPIACAYLIEIVAQRGYRAYWSCDADHAASIRLTQKLGFQAERPYKIYEYEPLIRYASSQAAS